MTSAELTFKAGFAPHLSSDRLRDLAAALDRDDPRITQGSTTTPPPLMCVQGWPVECGCPLAFVGALENGGFCPVESRGDAAAAKRYATVGQCEEYFATSCFRADKTMGEPVACRWFLNWWDDTPRDEARRDLSRWCREVLDQRAAGQTA